MLVAMLAEADARRDRDIGLGAADADVEVRKNITAGMTKAKQTSHILPVLVEGVASEDKEIQWRSAAGLAVAGAGG